MKNIDRIVWIFYKRNQERKLLHGYAVGYLPVRQGEKPSWKDIRFFSDGVLRDRHYPRRFRKLLLDRIALSNFKRGQMSTGWYESSNFNWSALPLFDVESILGDLNAVNYSRLEETTQRIAQERPQVLPKADAKTGISGTASSFILNRFLRKR